MKSASSTVYGQVLFFLSVMVRNHSHTLARVVLFEHMTDDLTELHVVNCNSSRDSFVFLDQIGAMVCFAVHPDFANNESNNLRFALPVPSWCA